MIHYTVRCEFTDEAVSQRWVDWLLDEHIQDVIDAGAISGEIVRMDGDPVVYEVRYRFAARATFDAYITNHASRLRDEGLKAFPLELGLSYSRAVGEAVGRSKRE